MGIIEEATAAVAAVAIKNHHLEEVAATNEKVGVVAAKLTDENHLL